MRRRFQLLTLAVLSLTACDDLTEPRQTLRAKDGTAAAAVASTLGTLDGTVYYSLCNLSLQGFVYRVNPNGGEAPASIQRGTEVRASSSTQRLAIRGEAAGALFTTDAAGKTVRNLGSFNAGDGRLFSWSADGKQVAAIWRGGPSGPEIIVYDDNDGFGHTEHPIGTSEPEPAGLSAFDWRAGKWVVDAGPRVNPPTGYLNQDTRVAAIATPPSATFSNLWTPQFLPVAFGLWTPMVDGLTRTDATGFNNFFANVNGGIRIDALGTVYWAGIDFTTNKHGIYRGTGQFYVNTGQTGAFAFSPNGDALVAVRMGTNTDGSTSYNLDIIDSATGGYVRTLTTSSALGSSGLMICSVDWMAAVANQTPPLAGLSYRGTGTANEFTFDGSGSTATTAGATITSYAWNFGDGTTGSGATITHAFATAAEHTVTLKVTDSNGLDASTSVTLSATLTIATVTPSSDALNVGDKFTLDVDVRNDGGVPITAVTPSAVISASTIARIDSGPKPASVDLAAGTHQHFTLYATALAAGSANAAVDAHGTGPSGTVNAQQRLRNLTVNGTGIAVQLVATPQIPDAGSQFTVTTTLTNLGAVDLVNLVGVLTTTPTTGINLLGSTPASIARLAPGAKADLVWKVTAANPGPLSVSVLASGHEDNSAALERKGSGTFTVTIADRRLVVTTTGDEKLETTQLDDKICDVDSAKDGNQCTLRAALMLANALGGAQTITFNIPGEGVPTISPQAALPTIAVPLTLDGTTQPSGWVAISGASAGDGVSGLVVDNGPTTIRGFVINGWKANGVWFRSGRGHLLLGNRIGADASGLAVIANTTGVNITGADVRIGGTVGTSATACTGDCNLISGNNAGVQIGSRGTATVWGNYIGTNVSGMVAVTNGIGVAVVGADGADPGVVVIGGTTAIPGRAPGNLISGNLDGVSVSAGTGHLIAGNLIGLNRTGSGVVPVDLSKHDGPPFESAGFSGVTVRGGSEARPVNAVVGGGAGRGNVISGFYYWGIVADYNAGNRLLVQGNRIGTTADGTAIASASPAGISNGSHAVGFPLDPVWAVGYGPAKSSDITDLPGVLEVRDNLISGNSTAIWGATVATGNMIGTDASGMRALSNSQAVAGVKQLGGIRPAGSRRCESPCNLISGNGQWAITTSIIQGNFIGTDLTGTRAIPNAFAALWGDPNGILGGASGAVRGICDRACNLISGNDESGVNVLGGTVQGNVFGAGIDGTPLGNGLVSNRGGSAIVVQTGRAVVGGDDDLGNLIVNNRNAAVSVAPPNGAPIDGVIVRGNSITQNGEGISYLVNSPSVPKAPRILSAVRQGATTTITVALSDFSIGTALSGRIDVYASPESACRPGVNPQGAVPIGSVSVVFLSSGQEVLTVQNLPVGLTGITATWTANAFTSSFSACGMVTATDPGRPTLTQFAPLGSDRIEVSSNTGFTVGGWAKVNAEHSAAASTSMRRSNLISSIGAGATNTEWKKIRGFGSLIFTSPLAFDHAVGETVEPADAPPATGWLLSLTGELTPFGGAPAVAATSSQTSQRTVPSFAGAATPTGRGVWTLTTSGVVQTRGDAGFFGDASTQLLPSETAISLLPISTRGYLIVTSLGRVLAFGDARSLGEAPRSASDKIMSAVLMPSHRGYLLISSCGAITGFGDTGSITAAPSGRCNVVAAAVPNQGTGVWLLHADGQVDALGGAPAFAQTRAIPNAVSIGAEGDGYVITDAIGRMYAFGTLAPSAVTTSAPVVSLIPLPR